MGEIFFEGGDVYNHSTDLNLVVFDLVPGTKQGGVREKTDEMENTVLFHCYRIDVQITISILS